MWSEFLCLQILFPNVFPNEEIPADFFNDSNSKFLIVAEPSKSWTFLITF